MPGRHRGARALAAVVVLASTAAAATAGAGEGRSGLRLEVRGGRVQPATICGQARRARIVDQGAPAFVRAVARARRGRLIVRVRRCDPSTPPTVVARRRLGGRTLVRGRLPTGAVADYRVTAEIRGSRRSALRIRRVAYVRVRESVIDRPISFTVSNVNRSRLPCPSDGRQYTIAGRLIAPRSVLGGQPRTATLYLHEFGWGRFFWQFPATGHDHSRELARAGHASVVIDRLGYDASSHPAGQDTCLGSQADIAHQVVQQLRDGTYSSPSLDAVPFSRITLAGHSGGGAIAELAAYSFGDVDGLVLFAYADQGFTPRSIEEATEQGVACMGGGEPAEPGGPSGYAYFAQTADEWKAFMFASAPSAVADAAAAARNRDPCGDVGSLTPTVTLNNSSVGELDLPVLLLYGTQDAIYEQPGAGEQQRQLFSGSKDVTLEFFEGTGHALTLERSAPEVRRVVADWLSRRGL